MGARKLKFKTEVKELLDLMIHSLYSHREIFLRELISNASDAIDKLRYESLTDENILEGDGDFKIKLIIDEEAGTITVSDNGIGMTEEDAVKHLGTIAHSGTGEFIKLLQSKEVQNNPELIGQFGVGFYSSFMVADEVTVVSRKAGMMKEEAVKWASEADGSFKVEKVEKETRGTDVTLKLKEDAKEYLQSFEIKNIVKKYSDFIEHPVVMDEEKKEEDTVTIEEITLNSRKAIWLKDKSDVTEEEYNEFYKHVSHDFQDPAEIIHYRAEGMQEFSVLLYIPSVAPFNMFYPEYEIGPTLYVKRVQIMDSCEELVPKYLRFLKGVVDSSDLPLNVSREILQNNKQVEQISKNITKKVLEKLKEIKDNDFDKYLKLYKEFGRVLKEGIHYDMARKEEIAGLMLYESTGAESGTYRTLDDYLAAMKPDQEEIFYITGASRTELEKSPYLEAFKEKGHEVLLMTDEIDDIIITSLMEYKGKQFKSALKGDIELDAEKKEEKTEELKDLMGIIKDQLGDKVSEVRLSGRLKDSPCCLVTGDGGMDANTERLMKMMGQEIPKAERILEINPDHELYGMLKSRAEGGKEAVADFADLLYAQALLLEGNKPEDPAEFAKLITNMMVKAAK